MWRYAVSKNNNLKTYVMHRGYANFSVYYSKFMMQSKHYILIYSGIFMLTYLQPKLLHKIELYTFPLLSDLLFLSI